MNVTPSIDIIGAGTGAITRAGPGTYIDSTGALQTAPANVLRMSYDPADLSAAPRPLFEPAATNLVTVSTGFGNGAWSSNADGLVLYDGTGAVRAPDGTYTASLLAETATLGWHRRGFSLSTTAGVVRRFSIFLKAAGRSVARGWSWDGADTSQQTFDLAAGTATGSLNPTMTPVGNGWYRCAFDIPAAHGFSVVFGPSDGVITATNPYAGDGVSGIYAWGAQIEAGSTATSYIPTAGAPVTRAADIITGTGLIYSSAIETAAAAYASGTTYAQGASVSVAGLLGALDCYTSLQGGNIGHSPASSPLYWAYAGTTYAPYASGTTFVNYQRCIDPVNHLVYESLIDGNTGASLADGTKWRSAGYTNPYAAFDTLRNTRSVGANPLVMVVKPGQRINALALVGIKATSANITLLNGYEVASCVTRDLNTRDASDAYKYCFNPFSNQEAVTLYDLPPYYDGVVVISLVNAFGAAECGGVFMGTYTYIGDIQYEAESDVLNFSTVTRDSEGNAEMQAERNVPKLIGQIFLDKRLVKAAYDLRDQLNGTTAVWDGLADDTDGYAKPLLIQGFYRRFTINVKYPENAIISLELEEV